MEQFTLGDLRQLIETIVTVVIAVVVWRLACAAVTKFYARRFVSRFIPRVPTYAGLTRSLAGIIVFFFTIVTLLHIWDVNVGPALWSAGALSVVIGIGAQAIVRDVLTGTFYLFEDTFDVGDSVELMTTNGLVKGTVDSIGLREVRVIDMLGTVVSVPYGSVVYAANATRLPTRITLNVAVPMRDRVTALRERITNIANTTAQSNAMHVDHVEVRLEDVAADSATFSISFHVNRQNALAAESSVRERIVTALQADGFLPGGNPTPSSGGPTSAAKQTPAGDGRHDVPAQQEHS